METIQKDENYMTTKFLPNVQSIDLEFQNITYTVHTADGAQRLLRDISGSFRSGEVTAVLGPSGAGKTTLLNILAGYSVRITGCEGTVLVNGQPRNPHRFRRLCCYIMQEALVQPQLNVLEAMMVASKLKVANLTDEARITNIMEILTTLGIDSCAEKRTEVLSGGQRKRLSIALELVSNPSVLFLDEPTTGLDTHAGKLVMKALTSLASQGRTVVCTVHQPSPLEFRTYNKIYIVARGSCVYSGPPTLLVPFLEKVDFPCPKTYSPADYIIELVQSEPKTIDYLALAVITEFKENKPLCILENYEDSKSIMKPVQSPTAYNQLKVLLYRMLIQKWRNKSTLYLQVLHHVLSSVLVGLVFFGIGNEGSEIIQNAKLSMIFCVFSVYTYVMISILYCVFITLIDDIVVFITEPQNVEEICPVSQGQ